MNQEKKILSILFMCTFWTLVVKAQETISTNGANVTGSGGSVSYSIGQTAYSAFSGTVGTITQGVQQPYEISVETVLEKANTISLVCTIYPNPNRGVVKLVFESSNCENLRYQLYNINGVLLKDKKVESRETEISMEILSSSVYFLKVIKNNLEVKVFKIVKR